MSNTEHEGPLTKYDFSMIGKELKLLLQKADVPHQWKIELLEVMERFASRSRLDELVRIILETEDLTSTLTREYVSSRAGEIDRRMVAPPAPQVEQYLSVDEARTLSINARSDELRVLQDFVDENEEFVDAMAIRRHIVARRALNVAMATRPPE